MKKIISAVILAVMLFSVLALCSSAAYTAPSIVDALTVLKGILNKSESDAIDVNNDGELNLKDVLYGIRRTLWTEELPQNQNVQLFGTNPSSDRYTYNYCPSVMEEEDGTLHVYYCTNKGDSSWGNMVYIDYIGYRKGTPNNDGTYTWSNETIVLSPSAKGAWDDKHNCDPSVIKGAFKYGDVTYSYLMAYLGCTEGDINDIGLAVANAPEGPFVKVGTTPVVDYTYVESSPNNWGVGQPSLVNKGGADSGKAWFFFTRGDADGTRTIVCDADFSDLNNMVIGAETKLENEGLVTLDTGARSIINNADFAYDDARGVLYASSGCHPYPTSAPNFIAGKFRVTSFRFGGTDIAEITYGKTSTAKWKYLATVDSEDTGYARNHNTGLVRDEYGHTNGNILTVFYTVANETSGNAERYYRIHSMSFVK